MIGDAPGDRDAAGVNGVLYFPILVPEDPPSLRQMAFFHFPAASPPFDSLLLTILKPVLT